MFALRFLARLSLGVLLMGGLVYSQALEAGVSRIDITPPPGLLLQGYSNPDRFATGTRDPLYARVLVLRAAATRLALVDMDVIAPLEPAYLAQLRAATHPDVSNVLVTAIHTHSGPALIPTLEPPPAAWEAEAASKIAAAIHQAATHMVTARLGVGYGVAYIGHNRLRHNHDGSVTWFEKNWTGTATAPVDPTVAVLRVDDDTGNPLAVLVNYACHPVIFGPDNRLYSSDFPGVMSAVIEKALGGKVMCFFLQGADGDINPYYAVTPLQQGAVEFRQRTGTELGVVAARVAQQIHTTADDHASLQLAEDYLIFRSRWSTQQWQEADPQNTKGIAAKTKAQYELPVTTLLINKQIAFLTMPGEPFVDLQAQWRARCPVRDCFFLGYTNGYHGYFPTIRAATWGGYGAAHPSTWIEVGAGEQMLNHGLVRVYEMLGRIKATSEDLQP